MKKIIFDLQIFADVTEGITVTGEVVTVDKTFKGSKINLYDYGSSVTKVNAAKTSKGLQIIGNNYANSLVSGSDADSLVGNAGNGTLTVKNGKGKKITIEDSEGNITTKKYSASLNSSAMWFAEENNFVTADNLSRITENNFMLTAFDKISSTNSENLVQENNFFAHSEK